jgi:hypothetical protein
MVGFSDVGFEIYKITDEAAMKPGLVDCLQYEYSSPAQKLLCALTCQGHLAGGQASWVGTAQVNFHKSAC